MLDRVEKADDPYRTLIAVDCEADAAEAKRAGFKCVRVITSEESIFVPVRGGAVLDPALDFYETVILAVRDPMLRDGLAVRIGDVKCRWIDLPTFASADMIRKAVAAAKPMWVDEVCLLSDIPDSGQQQRFATGFKLLDEHGFRVVRSAFMPIVGPYGSGKSVFIRQLACNFLRMHGWRCLITSFEEKVKPRYLRDLRCHLIGDEDIDPNGEMRWTPKYPSLWTPEDIAAADAKIEDGFRFLRRKRNSALDAERLVDRIEYAVKVYGVDVVVIDPVNEIDHQVPRGMSKTDYMGYFIMRLKQLADDYNLLMIVCAHPPKDGTAKRSGKSLLTLNDAADTAHYGNKADIGLCVWRQGMDENSPTLLHIDKLKDHDVMGRPTLAKMMLNRATGGFAVTRVGYEDVMGEMIGGTGD